MNGRWDYVWNAVSEEKLEAFRLTPDLSPPCIVLYRRRWRNHPVSTSRLEGVIIADTAGNRRWLLRANELAVPSSCGRKNSVTLRCSCDNARFILRTEVPGNVVSSIAGAATSFRAMPSWLCDSFNKRRSRPVWFVHNAIIQYAIFGNMCLKSQVARM